MTLVAQSDPNAKARRKRRRFRFAALVAGLAVVAVAIFWCPLFEGNFGVVDTGRVYRSRQPGNHLSEWVRSYHIAAILNLRGGSPADAYYADETRIAKEKGLVFYDLPMSASRRPTRRELLVLIDLFERGPYPLLIHCKSGSDRTGLATALYLMVVRGEPPERAFRAFTLHHGHVPLFGPERLHEPFAEYQAWLRSSKLDHTAARFRAWVEHDYQAADAPGEIAPLRPGPRAPYALRGAASR